MTTKNPCTMWPRVARCAAFALLALLLTGRGQVMAQAVLLPPKVEESQVGAPIENVAVETYGVFKPQIAKHYLRLHAGSHLYQSGVDHDFYNLVRLGSFRVRLEVRPGKAQSSVRLHWILLYKWIKPTAHPFYGDAPLSAAIQGVGFIVTAPPVDSRGSYLSMYTQFSKRANLVRGLFTTPVHVDPIHGNESDVILDGFMGRGVYRASEPEAINVYSWALGEEALFLRNNTSGTQFETGFRFLRTTDELPSSIVATSLYNTSKAPSRNPSIVAGYGHGCTVPAIAWRPPACKYQFRMAVSDAIGGFGATSLYRLISLDGVRYYAAGPSTIALHASIVRTGGVIPDSALVCATVRGYPKPFCGTDAEGWTAEYRINEAHRPTFEWVLFTEAAASRVRGAEAYALPYFTWHPDSGFGVIYHNFRVDLAHGQAGNRLTVELRGQLY